ncbi:MAG: hypothetical protein MI892_29370, partial [Desulfobacterales bacterium]|nr:hypothetical protein [Desulfobacterales bacterium]
MKLRTKLIIPIFSILILLALVNDIFTRAVLSDIVDYVYKINSSRMMAQVEKSAAYSIDSVNNEINQIKQRAIGQALIFASYPTVSAAYRKALTGNIDDENDTIVRQARAELKSAIRKVIPSYTSFTGQNDLKLHFHLPNNRSFARVWRDGWQSSRNGKKVDISDDLSSFRKTVVALNQGEHLPIKGIEVGRGGFVIRGITPVTGEDGSHLGSCEVFFSFNDILSSFKGDELVDYAFYMDARLLKTATSMKDSQKYPVLNNRYVLSGSSK